ncbi:hypothetical protein [Paenibacillus sp. yr247]|uniref:hypothetical protein n=1 Tax=Paenibacillus sp. yr247 TaxID=1761880 RepID=UPI001C31A354|nr:hypothetical protein [Paenibacillus sp. yr247]
MNLLITILMTVMMSACKPDSSATAGAADVHPVDNSAQFAIPPTGEIALASKFSYSKLETTPKMERKILYSLNENQLSKPLTEIPYYRQGKSELLPETVFKQYKEGHQPWLSSPVIVALVNCSNLISLEEVAELQNKAQSSEKKIIIDPDRVITEISCETPYVKVQMSKPGGITYDITMFKPHGTEVLFVKEIVENTPIK